MKIKCLYDEQVEIGKLKGLFHPKNRNTHPVDQVKRLAEILAFQGIRYPAKVSKLSGKITSGHGRILAAELNGWASFPVNYQDYDDEAQEYADVQADNAIASWAELDLASIQMDIGEFESLDVNMLGIQNFEVVEPKKLEPGCDDDDVPEVKESFVNLGDIWQLGNHRLMCGDSTSIDAVEKLMNGEKADMVFTDPPYNQETDGGPDGPIGSAFAKQSREIEHLCNFDPAMFLNVLPLVFQKNRLNAYLFCNKDLVVNYLKWARDNDYAYNILIWKKPSAIPIGGSYRPDVEYLLVFRKAGIFNGGIADVSYSKLLEYKREQDKVHPTMKPVEMIENQLKIASNPGSPVLDLFGGSGSTLIACEKTKRKCFMMEVDPHYCGVIVERWQKYTGKKAERITEGKEQ